jgi:hypothetical protein
MATLYCTFIFNLFARACLIGQDHRVNWNKCGLDGIEWLFGGKGETENKSPHRKVFQVHAKGRAYTSYTCRDRGNVSRPRSNWTTSLGLRTCEADKRTKKLPWVAKLFPSHSEEWLRPASNAFFPSFYSASSAVASTHFLTVPIEYGRRQTLSGL